MLTITQPVRVTRKRNYLNKRGKTVNLLCYVPLDGAGGEHEIFIPDTLNGGTPEPGQECSLFIELYLYPGVANRQDGSAFGTYVEGRRLAGFTKPQTFDLAQAA